MLRLTSLLALIVAALLLGSAPAQARRPVSTTLMVAPTAVTSGWSATAVAHRGNYGSIIPVDCPANGRAGSVWGSSVYTDDSSMCSAAVHGGYITVAAGGTIEVEILVGQRSYSGSRQHGLTSSSWGSWSGSFAIVAATPHPVSTRPRITIISWTDTATGLRGRAGQVVSYNCPARGQAASVWGSSLYTDDSSICTAAVHAGVITMRGGPVDIEWQPGASSYPASNHNGVTTHAWGKWSGSFIVIGGSQPPPLPANSISWADSATAYRGQDGYQATFYCPAGGAPGSVWGDSIYTDDSSICAAAVHEGLITTASGGEVTIEILPGEPAYVGSKRNGVTSSNWDSWTGSFALVP